MPKNNTHNLTLCSERKKISSHRTSRYPSASASHQHKPYQLFPNSDFMVDAAPVTINSDIPDDSDMEPLPPIDMEMHSLLPLPELDPYSPLKSSISELECHHKPNDLTPAYSSAQSSRIYRDYMPHSLEQHLKIVGQFTPERMVKQDINVHTGE